MLSRSATSIAAAAVRAAGRPAASRALGTSAWANLNLVAPDSVQEPLSLFHLTESEQMIRDSTRRFAQDVIKPLVSEMDEQSTLSPTVLSGLFELGLARIDPAVSVVCDVQNTLVNTVFRKYASEDLQKRYLPRLATKAVGSFCLSEAGSGSDAFALRTRAVPQDPAAAPTATSYSLSGTKMWITNAGEADVFLVFANINPELGYRGITCFVVERDMPGVSVGPKEKKLGIRASSTCPVILENVVVPPENILGEVGRGYKIAIEILNEGRVGIGAQMLGLAQGALDATMPYLYERKQFGQFIGDMPLMQAQYAQAAVEIEGARLMVYNAARLCERGAPFVKEAAIAKLQASRVAESVASKCVEMAGGVGFTRDFPLEKFYRDAKIGAIYEGTSNIQLTTIAKILAAEYKQ
ncbi:acyl-CoA dehydrogenase [Fonticula alba]|uniref:short-chain 2-methylacyl-CoA dehydrogenase n=1 Tax=Fonticula alba TaxID=691883 RepID=A0A058Z2C3_FONAL|nr:acyl-CoA dehydrogenase [Fonticula alba]KCV68405.1 acyl-CoA dehydrogenase [Fonticula alba]|eukprot:XP_009496837.1 acyl-CoA dehydrogenase [Fonticula alba]